MKFLTTLVFMLLVVPAAAEKPAFKTIKMDASRLEFRFGDQEGQFELACKHVIIESTQDWSVMCGETGKPWGVHEFTVHLRVRAYPSPKPPRLSYEILHWVTDQDTPVNKGGRFTGSTIWFRLEDPAELTSLDLGQDVRDTYVLRMHLKVNP